MTRKITRHWRYALLWALGGIGTLGLAVDTDATLWGLLLAAFSFGVFGLLMRRWLSLGRLPRLAKLMDDME